MARLPQAATASDSYGQRPSLRTNRLDRPAEPGIIADAVSNAAQTFATIAGEKKEKDDALNYALAKAEFQKADLEERQKFEDDEDWETYDERYRTALSGRRDDILSRYKLDPYDARLFGAESDLITERGSVQVQGAAKLTKLDNTRAQIDQNLLDAREEILNADPATAEDMLLNQIEQLRAAEAQGIYNDEEVLEKIQGVVTDFSSGRLMSMTPEQRIAELELSLAHRKARGPVTIEDIEKGKGSGSIADFLHRDVAEEMLRQAKDEDKISTMQGEVFGIIDEVMLAVPGTNAEDRANQLALARERLDKNDPEYGAKRNFLEQEIAQRQNQRESIKQQALQQTEDQLMNMLDAGSTYGSLPAGLKSLLPEERRSAMRRYAENVQRNNGFAEASDSDVLAKWYGLTRQEKLDENLNTIDWKNGMDNADWERALREQAAYRDAQTTQKDPNIYRGDPDDEILRNLLVGRSKFFKQIPTPGTEDYDRYVRIDDEVNRRLMDASLEKWRETGSGYLFPQEVHDITSKTVAEIVFIRDGGWFFFDEPVMRAGLSTEEILSGDIISKKIGDLRTMDGGTDSQGRPQNMEQMLRNIAGENSDDLSDEDIEHAYFLWSNGMTDEATNVLEGRAPTDFGE